MSRRNPPAKAVLTGSRNTFPQIHPLSPPFGMGGIEAMLNLAIRFLKFTHCHFHLRTERRTVMRWLAIRFQQFTHCHFRTIDGPREFQPSRNTFPTIHPLSQGVVCHAIQPLRLSQYVSNNSPIVTEMFRRGPTVAASSRNTFPTIHPLSQQPS